METSMEHPGAWPHGTKLNHNKVLLSHLGKGDVRSVQDTQGQTQMIVSFPGLLLDL